MEWIVEYYKDIEGNEPAADFIDTLQGKAKAKVFRTIKLLKEYGVLLKEPYTRQLRGKIRELRIKDSQGAIRVLYLTYTGKRFIFCMDSLRKPRKHHYRRLNLLKRG